MPSKKQPPEYLMVGTHRVRRNNIKRAVVDVGATPMRVAVTMKNGTVYQVVGDQAAAFSMAFYGNVPEQASVEQVSSEQVAIEDLPEPIWSQMLKARNATEHQNPDDTQRE